MVFDSPPDTNKNKSARVLHTLNDSQTKRMVSDSVALAEASVVLRSGSHGRRRATWLQSLDAASDDAYRSLDPLTRSGKQRTMHAV